MASKTNRGQSLIEALLLLSLIGAFLGFLYFSAQKIVEAPTRFQKVREK